MRSNVRTAISCLIGLLMYVCAGVSGAQAQNAQWTVMETAGAVLVVQPLMAPRPVSLQETVAPGSTLTTGGDGRAALKRGGQSIAVGPNSRIVLPATEVNGMTRIIQDFGAALFKVDKQQVPHFEVDTPMIAAVVKGTTFTVSAGLTDDSVHVVEGLVQVSPRTGGPAVPVPAGVTAIVVRNNPSVIDLKNRNTRAPGVPDLAPVSPATTPGAVMTPEAANVPSQASIAIPQTIGAEPLDVRGLTNGLVGPTNAPVGGSTPLNALQAGDAARGDAQGNVSSVDHQEAVVQNAAAIIRDSSGAGGAADRNATAIATTTEVGNAIPDVKPTADTTLVDSGGSPTSLRASPVITTLSSDLVKSTTKIESATVSASVDAIAPDTTIVPAAVNGNDATISTAPSPAISTAVTDPAAVLPVTSEIANTAVMAIPEPIPIGRAALGRAAMIEKAAAAAVKP